MSKLPETVSPGFQSGQAEAAQISFIAAAEESRFSGSTRATYTKAAFALSALLWMDLAPEAPASEVERVYTETKVPAAKGSAVNAEVHRQFPKAGLYFAKPLEGSGYITISVQP
jgi:hypothetical protein